MAGDQLPVTEGKLVGEVGNALMAAPWQNGPTGLNVGTGGGVTVILIEVVAAH